MGTALRLATAGILTATAILASNGSAEATEGYFRNAYGARHGGLAGAGVADGRDATAAALNPAGIIRTSTELVIAATVFSPRREYDHISGAGFLPAFDIESDKNYFLIPNIAIGWRTPGLGFADAVALTMYGNGGMNTTYPATSGGAFCPFPGMGPFCGGRAGVNLEQMMLSLAFAKQVAPGVSVGIAPILMAQKFDADGLAAFGGLSSDPAHLTNLRPDWAFGGGLRAGVEWTVMPGVRVAVAGTTPIWSQKFDGYRGLFAEGGSFDIPASIQAGFAVDMTKNVTLMADWRRIFYSGVPAINNPSTNIGNCALGQPQFCLGASSGAGFGWEDINVYKVGLEMRHVMPNLDLRFGYAFAEQPYGSRDVMFGTLAPGIVQHHFTAGGLLHEVLPNLDLEFAAAYVPAARVTGFELPLVAAGTGHTIASEMYQFEVTMGFKYRFGGPAHEPLK
ncbi:MAG TPA: hydrocarbon degradation protein [Hyphomicrobiaceae bacterium]|nr:hydrocarbon degradation protein [Hyphomicrobiaceae bacterium]